VLIFTVPAEIEASGTHPELVMATAGASEPLCPAKLKEIVRAGILGIEPAVKFNFIAWKIFCPSRPPL